MASSLLAGLTILMIGDSHLATPDYLIKSLHDKALVEGIEDILAFEESRYRRIKPAENICVSAPLREATSAFIVRPSGVVPKSTQRTASG